MPTSSSAFATPGVTAAVTWKPQLSEVTAMPKTTLVFDSSKTPGEILDLMVVNSAVLKANPKLGKALVGAWYETLARHAGQGREGHGRARIDGQGFGHRSRRLQGPARDHLPVCDAGRAPWPPTKSPDLVKKMDLVRKFSFDHGLLGEGAKTVDAVGIEFPGGVTLGNKANIKMRFDRPTCRWRPTASSDARRAHRAPADQPAPGAGRWARPGGAAVHRAAGRSTSIASQLRLAENPDDKLLPSLGTIADTFHSYAFEEDRRSGTRAVLGRHLGQPQTHRRGAGHQRHARRCCWRSRIGVVPRARALLSPLLEHRGDDSAAGRSCPSCSSCWGSRRPRRSRSS